VIFPGRMAVQFISFLFFLLLGPVAAQAADGSFPRFEDAAVITTDGYRLPLSRWLPEGKPCRVVLGLHGFNDYRETFADLAGKLSGDCTAFYAYDHRGFGGTADRGRWPGRSRLVNDATMVAELLRKRYPDSPLYLLGESMGGAVAILALTQEYPPPVDGAILLAPAVWARELQPWYQKLGLWLGVRLMPERKVASDWIDVDPSDDSEVLEYWRTHPMVIKESRFSALQGVSDLMDATLNAANRLQHPALILYGGEDEVIPPEATCALLQKLPDTADWRFAYYPDGYHMLTRYSGADTTIRDIRAWLASPEAALPSGRELEPLHVLQELCAK